MKVYTTEQAKALAAQVDRALPPQIRFYRYGDRTTQIIRFLIENEMDVAKTVTAIKQTALFRLYWHADEITISDVKDAFAKMEGFPTGVTEDGRIVWFLNCSFQTAVKIQDFMLASIYAVDDLQRRLYEECQRRGIQEAYKDYCVIVADTANVSYASLTTKMEKAGVDVFVRHFPSFMSVNDIFISDDTAFQPTYSWEHATYYNLNTPFYLRALWKVCALFMPSRWTYLVQLLGDQTLPPSFAKSLMPKDYGGTNEGSFQKWTEENATFEGVSLDTPPRQLVDQRVLDQFGENNGMIASAIPDTALKGWLWKRTNAGHRWHHYYFVLLQDGLLYYFKSTDDTDAQNGCVLLSRV